ncbi:MAG TPA: translocation/assembly module TamB domain-containing protein, partial [Longimicrobiales bacterium]|nr:translocation/assembly module TamB domain-containing protein [Longimicrobiales bacterium]
MRVAGFFIGLLAAIMLLVLLVPGRGGVNPTGAIRGGLITQTDSSIAHRMRAERQVVRPVRGDLTFHARDFVWKDPGHPDFVRASDASGRLDRRALQNLDFIVRGVVINGGETYVEQTGVGEWNYRRALDALMAGRDTTGPGHVFSVFDVAIQNARVRVKMTARSFGFDNLSAQLARIDFTAPGLAAPRMTATRATAMLIAKDSAYPIALENGRFEFPEGEAKFDIGALRTGETLITNFAGTWSAALPGYGLLAGGRVEKLRFEDVRFIGPRAPRTGTASFDFRLQPVNSVFTQLSLADARIESNGSRVTGALTVLMGDSTMALDAIDARFDPLDLALVEQIMGDTLPYRGTITGTARGSNGLVSFDVSTRLLSRASPEALIAHVTGSGRFASKSFEIRSFETELNNAPLASLRALFPSLPFKGNVTGRLTVTSPPGSNPLNVTGRLQLASGALVVQGRVDLRGAVPTYDLNGRLIAVNLEQIFEPEVPPVTLTARFSAVGSGFDPKIANARIDVEGRFTGWRTQEHDTLHLAARIANGTLTVDTAAMRLASMSGTAAGNWKFVTPASGAITYRVAFEPITPFGPYIPAIGDEDASGTIALNGSVTGALGEIRASGEIGGADLHVGSWSTASIDSKYELVKGAGLPRITLTGNVRELRTPTNGVYRNAIVSLKLAQPDFVLNVRADREGAQSALEIVADGRIPTEGSRELILQRARMELGGDSWSLSKPATFSWAAHEPGPDLIVRGFEMRTNDGRAFARLDGKLLPLASTDFKLETAAVPIGDLQRLLGRTPRVIGALTTTISIHARDGVPQLNFVFKLDSAVVENVRFAQLNGDASYVGQHLTANATAVVDTSGTMRMHADLPMDLRIGADKAVKMLETGPVRITLITDSMALAPLAAVAPGLVDRVSGSVSANVVVTGTVQEPVMNGNIMLRNAAMRLLAMNQTFDSINGTVQLQNREAIVRDFVARAGGRMRIGGTVEFRDLNKPEFDLNALFDRFQAFGVDNQDDAQVSGNVALRGPLRAAQLTGDLHVADGYFPVPSTGAGADGRLGERENEFSGALPVAETEAVPTPFYSGLVIDGLRLTLGPNLWFTMIDARAELAGGLTVDKHGEDMRITGDLEGERGTYVLRAGPIIRRFEVVHASVRFRGEAELNPTIDIIARRRIVAEAGRELNIDVHVGGTMLAPTLTLASQEAVTIPQSELLSFLLFGQPSFALGGMTSTINNQVLAETAVGTAAELIGMELEQTLLDQLGISFDIFQIRLGGSTLNNFQPSLVVGQEVA